MPEDQASLNQLTKEDYRKVLEAVQTELAGCVGNLIILNGFLESDLSMDTENGHYVMMAARDIVREACNAVKTALSRTYKMV